MYGTIARLRVKPGRQQALQDMMQEWDSKRRPKVKGAITGYILTPDNDPNGALMMAVFEDKESYVANAQDPEQDRWFRQFRENLEADPDWTDGEISQL
jgi:quinol monooxygenase YgiN